MQMTAEHVQGRIPITILAIHGDIDASNYDQVIAEARDLYAAGSRHLLLDLSDVPFMGSSGVVALHSIALLMRGGVVEGEAEVEKVEEGGTFEQAVPGEPPADDPCGGFDNMPFATDLTRDDYVITMYVLEDESCRRLLERSRFGRVGYVGDDGPLPRGGGRLPRTDRGACRSRRHRSRGRHYDGALHRAGRCRGAAARPGRG